MLANDLAGLDRAHLIQPVMPWRDHEARGPQVLASGTGAYVMDVVGRKLLDGFAGLWCVNVGYGQRSVVKSASVQMMRPPYAAGCFGCTAWNTASSSGPSPTTRSASHPRSAAARTTSTPSWSGSAGHSTTPPCGPP